MIARVVEKPGQQAGAKYNLINALEKRLECFMLKSIGLVLMLTATTQISKEVCGL